MPMLKSSQSAVVISIGDDATAATGALFQKALIEAAFAFVCHFDSLSHCHAGYYDIPVAMMMRFVICFSLELSIHFPVTNLTRNPVFAFHSF
jgi:hypothetical protein